MRKRLFAALAAVFLLLAGCAAPQEPLFDTMRTPFDKAQAEKILADTEECAIDLVQAGGGDRDATLLRFERAYGGAGAESAYSGTWRDLWRSFFDSDADGDAQTLQTVPAGIFFPTIYHEGIEVSEAFIETVSYQKPEDRWMDSTSLCILEKYVGDDPLLADFSRKNHFRNVDGNWVFDHFEGQLNVGADGLHFQYLPYKASYFTPPKELNFPYTIGRGTAALTDGSTVKIALEMTQGVYYDTKSPNFAPSMQTFDTNYDGAYQIRTTKGPLTFACPIPADKEGKPSGETLNFPGEFELAVADYNGDGNPDFTIGQPASSSIWRYWLFSVLPDGQAVQLDCGDGIFASADGAISIPLEMAGPTEFSVRVYNNAIGETIPVQYVWIDGKIRVKAE